MTKQIRPIDSTASRPVKAGVEIIAIMSSTLRLRPILLRCAAFEDQLARIQHIEGRIGTDVKSMIREAIA